MATAVTTLPHAIDLPARTRTGERAARRSLLAQIERIEAEVSALFASTRAPTGRGPTLLSVKELEELRDDLVRRLEDARRDVSERVRIEEQHRRRIEEMLLHPERHKWVRITNSDIGEQGCKEWHVRPRLGILGMLMGWWRVRISSGCPLAKGRSGP
jgi:hypothetical protein